MPKLRAPVRFWLVTVWIGILALCGGASRGDEPAQVLVRGAAVIVLILALWAPATERLKRRRGFFIFAAAGVALTIIQLIPLPPALWSALPGRDVYADIADAAGVGEAWRPISLTPDLTIDAIFALVPAIATLTAVTSLPSSDRRRLAIPIAVVAFFSAVLGLAQAGGFPLSAYRIINEDTAIGVFANRNHASVFLGIAIVLVGLLAPRISRSPGWLRLEPAISTGLTMLFLALILVIGSRAGVVAGLMGLIGGVIVYFTGRTPVEKRPRDSRLATTRQIAMTALPLIAIAGVLTLVTLQSRAVAIDRLFSGDRAEELRIQRIVPLAETAKAFFPVGSGMGSFKPVYERFEPHDQLRYTYANQAHNEPLQIVIEGGILAVILALIFLGWFARQSLATWRLPESSRDEVATARAGTIIVGIALVASVNDYPLRTPFFASVVVIACLWMANSLWIGRGERSSGPVA